MPKSRITDHSYQCMHPHHQDVYNTRKETKKLQLKTEPNTKFPKILGTSIYNESTTAEPLL